MPRSHYRSKINFGRLVPRFASGRNVFPAFLEPQTLDSPYRRRRQAGQGELSSRKARYTQTTALADSSRRNSYRKFMRTLQVSLRRLFLFLLLLSLLRTFVMRVVYLLQTSTHFVFVVRRIRTRNFYTIHLFPHFDNFTIKQKFL